MELRRGETSWSHRDDELPRQTTKKQRGVVDGEFFTERCPLASTAHTGPGRSSRRKLAFPTVDANTLDHSIPHGDSAIAIDVGELGTDESENNEQHARSHSVVSPAQQLPRLTINSHGP